MKLILCYKCYDIVKLTMEERTCKCGESKGAYYVDGLHAYYSGEHAIPLGFANSSLIKAIYNQSESGKGKEFIAFVIPKECSTFTKK